MKKQTAVEWLESEINKYIDYYEGKRDAMPYSLTDLDSAVQQAIEIEKEQIINAHIDGQSLVSCKDEYAEQYYNETYGNETK